MKTSIAMGGSAPQAPKHSLRSLESLRCAPRFSILLACGAALTLACSDSANSGQDNSAPACNATSASVVFNGSNVYDALAVQNGFVYVELPGAGVQRCPIGGCAEPTPVVDSQAFVSASLGSTVAMYTTQIAAPTGGVAGEIRSANIDGTGDQSVVSNLAYPAYVASSGASTFWAEDSFVIDDTPAAINCIGCNAGGSTPWISGLGGGTYGMMTDATNVYVLADDAGLMSVSLLSCSLQRACFSEPHVVITGLDRTVTAQQIASDGTNVYVARATHNDIVRIDAAGTVTPLVTQAATAIAVDAGNLYYGTPTGSVGRLPVGGGNVTMVACLNTPIMALAIDATSIYFITGASGSQVLKAAK